MLLLLDSLLQEIKVRTKDAPQVKQPKEEGGGGRGQAAQEDQAAGERRQVCPPSQTTKRRRRRRPRASRPRRPSSRRTPASLPPRRRPRCRPNVLLTRRKSLVDGELGLDLCHQARSCGCSIEFVKPIFHGLKYPYPGTKTYFKTPSSSGICKPPRALLILCTYNMIMI